MNNTEDFSNSLSDSELIDRIKKTLKTRGNPFSPEAETMIEKVSGDYAKSLIFEALTLASRVDSQQIGTTHVEEAKKRLLSIDKRGLKERFSGSFGGVFLGIGSSPFLNMWSGITIPTSMVIGGAFFLALGTGLLVFHISSNS